MDMDSSKDTSDFEVLLQKQSVKKRSVLYNNTPNTRGQTYQPQDVIKSVYYQVKAIQKADCLPSETSASTHLNIANKSQFLPVNKLRVYSCNMQELPKTSSAQFDTQCYLDSQLLNIIDGAEALDSNTGMTQEFDTTFAHLDDTSTNNDKDDSNIGSAILKEKPELTDIEIKSSIKQLKNKTEAQDKSSRADDFTCMNNIELDITSHINLNGSSKTATDDTVTFIQDNISKTQEEIEAFDISLNKLNNNSVDEIDEENIDLDNSEIDTDTGQNSQRSKSPILNIRYLNRKLKPSPIVVSQEKFEQFETLAMLLIEETDFQTAKRLINSQILGQELCLNDDTEILLQRDSPVLDYLSNELQIKSEDLLPSNVKNIDVLKVQDIDEVIEKSSDILEDEILFSSDEEDFYRNDIYGNTYKDHASSVLHNINNDQKDTDSNNEELPLTCALESADDEPANLDDTLFVGFQTASNKSIQICKESYSKAQSIFGEDQNSGEISLKDLVARCERSKSCIDQIIQGKLPRRNSLKPKSLTSTLEYKECSEGFNTAQSIKALQMSQENSDEGSEFKFHELYKNNKLAIDKMNDESLLEEFENIEMTLGKKNDPGKGIKSIQFQGYKNKKNTEISDETIENTKTIFLDIDSNLDTKLYDDLIKEATNVKELTFANQPSTSSVKFVGFKTANNKEIKISEEALSKTKDIFQDIGKDKKKIKPIEDVMSPPSTNKSFEGFKTASNKNINISEAALFKTKNVFKDIDKEEMNLESPKLRLKSSTAFKTANNSDRKFSDAALFNTKHVFKHINNEVPPNKHINSSISNEFIECRTAHNKDFHITKAALAETKKIFENIDKKETKLYTNYKSNFSNDKAIKQTNKVIINDISDSNKSLVETDENLFVQCDFDDMEPIFRGFENHDQRHDKIIDKNNKTPKKQNEVSLIDSKDASNGNAFMGFKTASNKIVSISSEALKKSKKMLDSIELNYNAIADNVELKGLETASKKSDAISAEAIARSITIFQNIDENDDNILENIPNTPKSFKDFITASNKRVDLNSDTLIASRKLLQNPSENLVKRDQEAFTGFKTASNKMVSISSDALEKSKKILDSIYIVDEPIADQNKNVEFKDFQTASKKPVSISAEAIAKSKIIFKDIDENADHASEKILKATERFKGFQTASNKQVDIDSDALIASKKLLEDSSESHIKQGQKAIMGFKTASNKNVKISEEAIVKSKKLLEDIQDMFHTSVNSSKETTVPFNKGFQTASKKRVEISDEAIEKTKKMFDDIDDFRKQESIIGIFGFRTANNNDVKISEQALAKSRQVFQDISDEKEIDSFGNNRKSSKNENLVTKQKNNCNNNKITITDVALEKSETSFPNDFSLKGNIKTNFVKKSLKLLETTKDDLKKSTPEKSDVFNIESMLDTQVINNFNENLCTEDFKDTPRPNKRPGSPILFCPKAKRRKKFETPYKVHTKVKTDLEQIKGETKPVNTYIFREDYKKMKEYTLEDISKIENGKNENIDPYISYFNLENILKFEFMEDRNDLREGKITIEEVKQIFTEGTDKKLIPDGWLDIQIKLIIWKLISYEIRFPKTLGKVCTVKNVMDQLKYRYDKELYNAERPILRKILEKDDIPMRTMVLCVAGIFVDGVSVASATNLTNLELLLTDGWYFIRATIDNMLSKLVYDGKLTIGSKIVTCGAELVNCEQGVAPWEDISSVRLSISGNSTLPAPWHAKLGLRPTTLRSRLRFVRVGGGKASRLRLRVTRVYPSLYVEKFPDGSTVTRSERLEHQYQAKYETENEAIIEKIYEEVENEMSDQESQDSGGISEQSSKRRCYETGSQIAKMMKNSRDPMEFRAQLSSSQIHLLQDHVSRQREKYLQTIQSRVAQRVRTRNVVTLSRGRVVDVERDGDKVRVTKGMLSIWKPNDDVLDIFKEGSWIEVTNVVPTAFRNSEIQVSAGRQSFFRPIKVKEYDMFQPYLAPLSRSCYLIQDLSQNPAMTTEYNEIDTVGITFSIDPPTQEFNTKNQFQNVYLADIDKNIIAINFWGGIKKFGYENLLDNGQVVYCGNLQKRAGNTRKNIPQYRATEFSIFTKTPKNEKAREIIDEINKKINGLDRRKFCEDCIAVKQNYSVLRCFGENQNMTPCRFDKSDYSLAKNKMFIETPVVDKVKNKAEDFNLTGLDFESTFRQTDTQEFSPKTMQRKKKVNEKIAKLKMYGEPPPLSPINIINKSKNATNSYKSPLVKNAESTVCIVAGDTKVQNVATPTKPPENNSSDDDVRSPVIPLNRTYVKRCGVNPVKLNFSENAALDKSVDHFAEEFDGSPPLSLE